VRLARRVAQVVVKAAWLGVGPAQNMLNFFEATGLVRQVFNRCKSLFQLFPVIKRVIEGIQVGSAVDSDGLVLLNT